MRMSKIMKYEGRLIGGCLGAMIGGVAAAGYLTISDFIKCVPLERELREIRVQIGENMIDYLIKKDSL